MNKEYKWVPFYEALADKLLEYKDRQTELFELIRNLADTQPHLSHFHFRDHSEDWWPHRKIDPFSIIAALNRGVRGSNRTKLAEALSGALGMNTAAPTSFDGIPELFARGKSFFVGTDEMWNLFTTALRSAETGVLAEEFTEALEKALAVKGNGLIAVTMGLFWIRPKVFMSLDKNSQVYIKSKYGIDVPGSNGSSSQYVKFILSLKSEVDRQSPGVIFPEISEAAYAFAPGEAESPDEEWWPLLTEYNPGITKETWLKLLTDNSVFDANSKTVMSRFLRIGGTATCKQLSEEYGKSFSFYIGVASGLAKRVINKTSCPVFEGSNAKDSRFWPVLFFGRNAKNDEVGSYVWRLRPELQEALEEFGVPMESSKEPEIMKSDHPKNLILYGPPGTGKTYNTVFHAVAIIEEKPVGLIKLEGFDPVFERYQKYKGDGLIAFITFHQSYGYEEFIEGIRPVINDGYDPDISRDISYEYRDGVFKSFCTTATTPIVDDKNKDLGIGKSPAIWKVSLEGTGDNPTRKDCLDNNHIRIGWDSYGESISDAIDYSSLGGRIVLNTFYNRMQIGDIVMSCYSSRTIDAIGVVAGDPEWHDEYPSYKRLRKVNWLVKDIKEDIFDLNDKKSMTLSSVYKLSISVSDVLALLQKNKPELFSKDYVFKNHVFIIDEINRGNISKIFGELITLIETSKRYGAKEELSAILPYTGDKFGVPDNVYIIGTMNTADRSIALLDTALRRRFSFIEMQPDPYLLEEIYVGHISVAAMLRTMNNRITVLLDREHTVGHSFLLPLKYEPTIERLAEIFKDTIVPLLQEYFFDDYEKIRLVSGDNQKAAASVDNHFIVKKNAASSLFGSRYDEDFRDCFEINPKAFTMMEAYEFLQ